MNTMLNRLYGFDELGFGTEGANFGWTIPISGWTWLLIAIVATTIGLAIYARSRLSPLARWTVVCCRSMLLILLIALSLGPRLEKPRTRVEPDRVLYLVDRSASMTITDGRGESRDQQLRGIVSENSATLEIIAGGKDARWYAFGGMTTPLDPGDSPAPELPEPAAPTTRLGDAIASTLSDNAGHAVSAVVILSDGRSTDAVGQPTVALLRQAGVPVFGVPLGSASQEPDLAVTAASAPSIAFVNDTVPVTVSLESGFAADTARTTGRVEIIDTTTGLTIESRDLEADDLARGSITLPVRLDRAGNQDWTVRFVPDGPDLSPTNNEVTLGIRFVDEPIRVLYLDGSPRWEQRYLKTLLIREESIDASCLLLATDRRFQQEGNTVLQTLPTEDADWDEFDLIIVGDLRPELLGERAISAIRSQAGERSTGLLWLAGPSANPHAWAGSQLADLLPVRLDSGGRSLPLWNEPVLFSPTPIADRLGLFRDLVQQGGISDPDAGWSRLRWAVRVSPSQIKPSAEPFATALPASRSEEPTPLVLGMRYGAGRTALVATDEIWRWRYGRGEPLTERFWLPMIRHLARPRLAGLGTGATIETSARVVPVSQQVAVELVVTDRETAEVLPPTIDATASSNSAGESGTAPPTRFTLIRDASEGNGPARYRGAFTPVRPGALRILVADSGLLPAGIEASVDVIAPNDEMRSPQTDHETLASLSRETGGRMIAAEEFSELASLLPNRRVITPLAPETRTLWDHPAPLAVLLLLASCEWIIRRRSRLP